MLYPLSYGRVSVSNALVYCDFLRSITFLRLAELASLSDLTIRRVETEWEL